MDKVEEVLLELLEELRKILGMVREATPPKKTEKDYKEFFDYARKNIFGGRLTQGQVDGMTTKLALMDGLSFPLSWKAYVLATSFWETGRKMLPVKEGLKLSEDWRKRNLRYYPWYGRGDVQLTWKSNYSFVDKELNLGGKLLINPDLALDPKISAEVIVYGMRDGWFSKGNSMKGRLPMEEATREDFRRARPIVNLMDKAGEIADIAVKFQEALKE